MSSNAAGMAVSESTQGKRTPRGGGTVSRERVAHIVVAPTVAVVVARRRAAIVVPVAAAAAAAATSFFARPCDVDGDLASVIFLSAAAQTEYEGEAR